MRACLEDSGNSPKWKPSSLVMMAMSKEQQSDCQRRTNDNQFYCVDQCNCSILWRFAAKRRVQSLNVVQDATSQATAHRPNQRMKLCSGTRITIYLHGTQDEVAWGWPRQAAAKRADERRKACMLNWMTCHPLSVDHLGSTGGGCCILDHYAMSCPCIFILLLYTITVTITCTSRDKPC